MKKIIILILLLIPSYAFALGACISGLAGGATSASCTASASPTDMDANSGTDQVWYNATYKYRSSSFQSDGSTICAMDFYLGTTTGDASSAATFTVYIYSDDGSTDCNGEGCPNELLATFGTFANTDITPTGGWTPKVTGSWTGVNATVYHLVIGASAYDNTNRPTWSYDTTCAYENKSYSSDASSWTAAGDTSCNTARFYK